MNQGQVNALVAATPGITDSALLAGGATAMQITAIPPGIRQQQVPPAQVAQLVQAAPQVQHNFIAQAAPAAAVHTVQMPFPIDSQGVKFVPSLPTWTVWTLSVLTLLVVIALLLMTSVWSSKSATVLVPAAVAAPVVTLPAYTVPSAQNGTSSVDAAELGARRALDAKKP